MSGKVFIKERNGDIHRIRTNTYSHTIKFFNELFALAKADYPDLREENVEVLHFAGRSYARTFGIEFRHEPTADGYQDGAYFELIK